MKKERGWFQIGLGLVLFLSFGVGLAGCAKLKCGLNADHSCTPQWYCTCP